MTALPARCRNTNDALRKPVSVTGCRVRRARADRSWVRPVRGLLRSCGRAAPLPRLTSGSRATVAVTGPNCSAVAGAPGGACGGAARPASGSAGGSAGPSAGGWPLAPCGLSGSGTASGTAAGSGARLRGRRARRCVRDRCGRRCCGAPGAGTRTTISRGSTTGGGAGRLAAACAGRRGGVVGKRCVQRWRRNPFGGFGCADHDPVPRRILHEMCGVAGRDHAELAGGLGEGGCGLRLQHVALEGFLLLQQRLVGLPGAAQLIGPLGGVGRQPQRDAQAQPERSDDQHHERDLGRQRARVEVDGRNPGDEPSLEVAGGRPWAPWPFAPWRAPWPGWRSSAGRA